VFTYPNGDRYEGEWRRDQLWGTGTFTWANGDRYQVPLLYIYQLSGWRVAAVLSGAGVIAGRVGVEPEERPWAAHPVER